jgi:hypothetical protein
MLGKTTILPNMDSHLPLTFSGQHTNRTGSYSLTGNNHILKMAFFTLTSAGAIYADCLAIIFYLFYMPAITLGLAECFGVSGDIV